MVIEFIGESKLSETRLLIETNYEHANNDRVIFIRPSTNQHIANINYIELENEQA